MKLAPDKRLHLYAGFIIYVLCFFAFQNHIYSSVAVAVAGIGKEIYDYERPETNTMDFWDAVFTFIGGALGFAAIYLIKGAL